MKKYSIILLSFLFIYLNNSCTSTKSIHIPISTKSPVQGAWEMQSISWITKDTSYIIEKAQPGIFIFSDNYYSIMWTPTRNKRVPFKTLSKPTDKELISGFRSIVFNGGTYVYTDSTLTSTATIAKVPGFEGGKQFYTYNIEEDKLTITMFDETYPDGTKPDWSGKYKTEFKLFKTKK